MKFLNFATIIFLNTLVLSCASEQEIKNILTRHKENSYKIDDFRELKFNKIYELKETKECSESNFKHDLNKFYFIKKYMLFRENGYVYSSEKLDMINKIDFDGVIYSKKDKKFLEKLDVVRPKKGDTIINGTQRPELIVNGNKITLKYWKSKCSVYELAK